MEELSEAHVGEEILAAVGGVRPGRVLQQRLASQLVGDAQSLPRSEARDALAPVRVLGLARCAPVPGNEFPNPACDHSVIIARGRAGRACCTA